MNYSFLLALSTLVGTIVGAGIFGIPFVVAKSGVVPSLLYFVLLGGAVMLLHLFFGEVCLRTKEKARLIGYSGKYLGGKGRFFATFSTVFGIVGALLAYTILGGQFLKIVFGSLLPFSETLFTFFFWAILSLFIFRGIQLIARAEFIMNIALFLSVIVIFLFAAPHLKLENFTFFNLNHVFLPYGVILFALAGWSAIPEIADFFKQGREKRSLDNLIVLASVITAALYFMFALFVVGVSGSGTSPDALQGLVPFLGKEIIILGALFGLVAIAASFLVLGNYLKNSLRYDFKLPRLPAAAIATLVPIILFFAGFREFVAVLGIVGIVMGIVEGVLIVLLFRKAKEQGEVSPQYNLRLPRFVPVLVAVLLVGGAVAELLFAL